MLLNRQIYKGEFEANYGKMANEVKQWWEGLGKELEIDIETFDD